jgi:hypothetical protein
MIQWSLQQRGIVPVNSIIQINMIDETTKFNRAEGYYKRIALVGNTGGVFKQLVAFNKKAEDLKNMMNKKYGPGTMKYGSEISQPEIKTPQAIFEFTQRNPAAEGGRMKFDDGLSAKQKKALTITYPKDATKDLTPTAKRAVLKSKIDNIVSQGTTKISRKDLMKLVEESGLAGSDVRKQLNKLEKNHPNIFSEVKILSVEDLSGSKDFEKFLNKKLKTLKGPIETSVPNLIAESGIEIDTPTADSVIRKNKNLSKNFVLSFGRKLDPVVEKNLTEAINAYKKLPKKTKFDFQTGGMGQEEKLEKFLKQFDLQSDQIGKNLFRNRLQSLDLYEKAPIVGPNQQKIMQGRSDAIGSAKAYEDHLYKFKKKIQESLDIPKTKTKGGYEFLPIDMAHRTDIYQLEQLGEKLKVEDYGPEYEIINRKKVKSLENKLTPLYETQSKLYNEAKNSQTISNSLKEKIVKNNEEILEAVGKADLDGRIKPITIDPNNLKIKRGQNIITELGIGLVDTDMDKVVYPNKKNNFTSSLDDVTIKANLAEQTFKEAVDAGLIDEVEGRKKLDKFLNSKPVDYIDGKGGTTLSSGFNTDLLMKDKTIQKIVNSKAGKAVANGLKNAARTGVGATTKVFGIADIVLGVLDLENNLSKGESFNVAAKNAIQAASINLWKVGDEAKIEEIKERFVAKGGSGEIFDQATDLNKKDQEINDLIYAKKRHADKVAIQFGENPNFGFNSTIEDKKEYYNTLKKESNEEIAKAIQERDNMIESYKTNLRVSEAGAPIQIGGNEFFSQPFKDIKEETIDRIEEENKFSYPMQKRQLVPTAGNIGNWLLNNVMTLDPQEKIKMQKYINEMDERELYKFNLERGMDPDNLIRFEDILRYKTRYPELMGVNTTKYINRADRKSEGGITGLRSKYEYKK